MNIYEKVVLSSDTEDPLVQNHLQNLTNLVGTSIAMAYFKPKVKKKLEEDPEYFLKQLVEGYMQDSIEFITDQVHEGVEDYRNNMKHIEQHLPPGLIPLIAGNDPEEMASRAISEYVEKMQEAREIFYEFMFGDK